MKNQFNIGDRVEKTDGAYKGKCGRVIGFDFRDVCVEFDEYIDTHDCGGRGKDGHCWYCDAENIKLLPCSRVIFSDKATVLIKDGKKYVSKCKDGDAYDKEKGLLLCLAQANGISYRDLQEMIAGAKDCNAEKAKEFAGKLVTAATEAAKAFAAALNGDKKADDKAQVREVKRKAKEGEYIKIVKAHAAYGLYKNGDILKVYKTKASGVYCEMPKKTEGGFPVNDNGNIVILHDEYVVLENYTPYKITLSEFWKKKERLAIHCVSEEQVEYLHKTMLKKGYRNSAESETICKGAPYTLNDKDCVCVAINQTKAKLQDVKATYEFDEVDLEN